MQRKWSCVWQLLEQITQVLRQWHFFFSRAAGTIKRTMKNNTERSSFLPHVYTLQQTGFGTSEFKRRGVHCGSTEGGGALTESLRPQQPSESSDLSTWMWLTEGRSNHPPRPISKICPQGPASDPLFNKRLLTGSDCFAPITCCKPVNKDRKIFSYRSIGRF